MSAYASVDDVRRAVDPEWVPGSPEPLAGAQDASQLSDAQLADAILEASARVDSYISGRYQTPVAPLDDAAPFVFPDQTVLYWTRNLAAYLASLTWFRSHPMESTEPIYLRAADTMREMTAIRDGKGSLNLPGAETGDASESAGGYAGVVDYGTAGLFDVADAGFHPGATGWGTRWPDDRWDVNVIR